MSRHIHAADLFCGAGGTSTGLRLAVEELGLKLDLLVVNHWQVAIETHQANHPYAQHLCEEIDGVNPRKAVPRGRLDILVASPECLHHSRARGGRPMNDQSRASAWHVLRWAEALRIDNILVENVPEFRLWGALGTNGLPLKSRKGETYNAFLNALRSLGYVVEDRVLNAANYGDPTTRERLFILARRGRRRIVWPEPTHTPNGQTTLFGPTQRWRAAREIIDWSVAGESIFNRKRPLSANTMARIAAGLKKFGGAAFVLPLEGFYRGNAPRSLEQPLPTITQRGVGAVVQPFILNVRGGNDGYLRGARVDAPLPTVTATSPLALVEPFIIGQQSCSAPRSVNEPLPTIATKGAIALVEPFLVEYHGGKDGANRVRPVDVPLPTQDTSNRFGLVQPFLVKYNGEGGGPRSVDEPLDTLTAKDRFGLVVPELAGAVLDIRFRMLLPHELARAMSFPDEYRFAGNRSEVVRQIGNAVPVQTAKALCLALLKN